METTREREPIPRALQHALGGRYVLERRLGRGGMGDVYLAREPRLARRVAIKVLPPDRAMQPAARERFLREARTAAGLSHPNIVPIFAVDEVDDFVFFVMAYVDGESLGQRIRTRGPLPPAEVARVLKQVARALAYAHDHGVVHRDVKPDNILLENPTGRVLVTDFGIARVGAGSGNTGPREVMGTAEFMSPEQASAAVVDGRSDLYSLGVVAYYVLSGRLPFEERDAYALMARHATEPAPPLASVAPAVPRPLARIVDRCLAKEPWARFARGSELAEAIDHAAPLQAAPPIAVRAFLVESRHLSGPALVYATLAGLAVPLLAGSFWSGETLATKLLAAGGVAWVLLFPLGYMVRRVRRLFAAGFERGGLGEGLEAAGGPRCVRRGGPGPPSGPRCGAGACRRAGPRLHRGAAAHHRAARYRPLPPPRRLSLSPASLSCSSVLQNAKRTSFRPSSGRLKKLEPGTGATPASQVSQRAYASSGRSESAEKSART